MRSWARATITSGSSWRSSIARIAARVPSSPCQRRPGHRPPRPITYRRAVSAEISMVMRPSSQSELSGRGRFRRAHVAENDERAPDRVREVVDIRLGRDDRDGAHPARRQVEAFEQEGEEHARARTRARRECGRTGRRPREDLEQRPDGRHPRIEPITLDRGGDARPEPLTEGGEPRVARGRELAERRESRRGRNGTAIERAAMADRAGPSRVEDRHHVFAATERRERIAASDDLPERGEVGADPVQLLRATPCDPERDDLVEDQQGARAIGELAQPRQEAVIGGADAAGALDWLDDDRGEIVEPSAEGRLDAVRITPWQDRHQSV